MTEEGFYSLSTEEYLALSDEDVLKHRIRFSEAWCIWYKKIIEEIYQYKKTWPSNDEFVIWYKNYLREGKNREESKLKELRLEIEHLRQGLNPPSFYPEYWNNKGLVFPLFKVKCECCKDCKECGGTGYRKYKYGDKLES